MSNHYIVGVYCWGIYSLPHTTCFPVWLTLLNGMASLLWHVTKRDFHLRSEMTPKLMQTGLASHLALHAPNLGWLGHSMSGTPVRWANPSRQYMTSPSISSILGGHGSWLVICLWNKRNRQLYLKIGHQSVKTGATMIVTISCMRGVEGLKWVDSLDHEWVLNCPVIALPHYR